jgi:hypothetical protein
MFLPSFRYTPAVTEALGELERLCARIAATPPPLEALPGLRRTALARRAAGAATLDSLPATPGEAARALAGDHAGLAPATQQAIRAYAFALEQIAGDWPADREVTALPVLAGVHFFVTHDPSRRGPLPALRRGEFTLIDARTGAPLAPGFGPADLRPALQDLMGWLHAARSAVAPAIRAGVAYLRLMQILPQEEANARTACAYLALLLHGAGLLPHDLPGVEAAFAADLDRYYAALLAGAWGDATTPPEVTPWLEYFLTVLREEVRAAHAALRGPGGDAEPVRLNPRQRRILELLQGPDATLANQECQEIFGVSPVTAARDFRELVDLGLVEMRGQGRATYYLRPRPAE